MKGRKMMDNQIDEINDLLIKIIYCYHRYCFCFGCS
jgi:hypothetical protein